MAFRAAATASFLCLSFWTAQTKIYDRCELARELRDVHEFPEHQLATWLCIANYESHFNTSAHNPGSGDHGIFQISELYWCSPPGNGFACGLPCSALKDDDIEDDAVCARRIYRQHQRMSGDGFTAWVVYNLHCRDPAHVASFLQGCFDEENYVKYYGYQPIYEAMNLPTVKVPMPLTSPSPPPPVSSPTPIVPLVPSSAFSLPPSISSLSPPSSPVQPSSTTKPPNRKTTPYPKVQFKSTVINKVPPKPVTTPRPHISTYKPLLNLSRFTSSAVSNPLTQVYVHKPVSSTFVASPAASVKPTVANSRNKIPTSKPQLSTVYASFVKTPIPTIVRVNKVSTYKPVPSTFRVTPAINVKSSVFQRPTKGFTYKSIYSTTPATTARFTTAKPAISTYKPFLNRFSFTFQAAESSPVATTPRPSSTISTYKPFINNFSTVYKPHTYSFSTPKQISSSLVSSSGLTASPFSSSSLFINNDGYSKATVVKPRETTKNELPFTLKSGVKPFEFNRNETLYAYVNNPGYSFAISSHGFKFLRTAK